jgi:hypothetical protein
MTEYIFDTKMLYGHTLQTWKFKETYNCMVIKSEKNCFKSFRNETNFFLIKH